jgi:hypothetical protein
LNVVTTLPGGTGPVSMARAYLGDLAVAAVQPGPAIVVDVERHYSPSFGRPLRIAIGPGPVTALTVTMDYRSDILMAWQQGGSIYAHMVRASGRTEPTQRLGPSGPHPQLQAVVSDDNRGVIAWASATAGPVKRTVVRLAISSTGVRFAGQRLIASFPDIGAAGLPAGSLALVRLATEDVLLAWTTYQRGHYVVLAAPALFAGVRPPTRVTPDADQAVLAALAPGSAGEAVALWRQLPGPRAAPGWAGARLWAARTVIERQGRVQVSASEAVGGTGSTPVLAVDPADDRPVAAWLEGGPGGAIDYAVGSAAPYREHGYASPAGAATAGVHWLRITAAAVLALAVALAGWALARGRGTKRTRM